MPLTAVLSRTLHDALGNEAAADLVDWMNLVDTHRSELRELNEFATVRGEAASARDEVRAMREEMRGEFGC